MNKKILTAVLAAIWFCPLARAAARLDSEAAKQLAADIRHDRAELEKLLAEQRAKPEPRAAEEKKFRDRQIQDKLAFESSLAGLSVDEKKAAHAEYAARRFAEEKAHAEKLKSIKPLAAELAEKRRESAQKLNDRLKEAYS